MSRLAPRSCMVCGAGTRRPCVRCCASFGHRHLAVLTRTGDVEREAALCEACLTRMTVGGASGSSRLRDVLRACEGVS